eukprot:1013403_1
MPRGNRTLAAFKKLFRTKVIGGTAYRVLSAANDAKINITSDNCDEYAPGWVQKQMGTDRKPYYRVLDSESDVADVIKENLLIIDGRKHEVEGQLDRVAGRVTALEMNFNHHYNTTTIRFNVGWKMKSIHANSAECSVMRCG